MCDYNYNSGNVLLPWHMLGTESDEDMDSNGEELKGQYLREAGRELTNVDINADVEEAHGRGKHKYEL